MSCVFNSARSRIRLIWTAVVHTVETTGEVTPFEVILDSKPTQVTLDPDQTLLAVRK